MEGGQNGRGRRDKEKKKKIGIKRKEKIERFFFSTRLIERIFVELNTRLSLHITKVKKNKKKSKKNGNLL